MIIINQDQLNTFVLYLKDSITIENPYYIFNWRDTYNREVIFSLPDESSTNFYNKFSFDSSDHVIMANGLLYVYESSYDASIIDGSMNLLTPTYGIPYQYRPNYFDDFKVIDVSLDLTDGVLPIIENDDFYFNPLTYTVDKGIISPYASKIYVDSTFVKKEGDVDGTPLTTTGQILVWHADTSVWDADFNIKNYLKEASLGTAFVWSGGKLDVSIVSGYSTAYIDGSLNTLKQWNIVQDASIVSLRSWNITQDASIVGLNSSLGSYTPLTYLDSSLKQLHNQIDVSMYDTIDLSVYFYNKQEIDAINATFRTSTDINASLNFYQLKTGGTFTGRVSFDASVVINGSSHHTQRSLFDASVVIGTDGSNNITLDKTNGFRLNGTTTVWEDLVVPLTSSLVGINARPDFDFNEVAYMFPENDATEILYFVVQMPHRRKVNSNVYPHVHYRQKTSVKPIFKLDYKWFNIGGSVPNTWKTYVMDASAVAWVDSSTHQIAQNGPIDGSTYGISSMMLCKLYRQDASVSGDVAVWQFDIHFESDSLGSNDEYAK